MLSNIIVDMLYEMTINILYKMLITEAIIVMCIFCIVSFFDDSILHFKNRKAYQNTTAQKLLMPICWNLRMYLPFVVFTLCWTKNPWCVLTKYKFIQNILTASLTILIRYVI